MSDTGKCLLYSPSRRGYMRATVEDGIRAELDAMNAEASGTPFYGATEHEPSLQSSTAGGASLTERLARLTTRKP